MAIHFGTSGWRAVVANEFTFAAVAETPVGFKFIGELINEDQIVLAGEESAGLSIKGHYPEKDGILACLLAAEAVAACGASLTEQLETVYSDVGRLESGRMPKLKDRLAQEPSAIAEGRVKQMNRLDGLKIIFEDDSWLLVRPSGRTPGTHLCGIRIAEGHGGVA